MSGEHYEGPVIDKLATLARNPSVASLVHSLVYRCYLPPHFKRNGDSMLEKECSVSRSLTADIRTIHLVKLAVANMVNLRAVSMIHGHHYMVQALLGAIFAEDRNSGTQVEELMLDSCSVAFDPPSFFAKLNFSGLKKISMLATPLGIADPPRRWKVMVNYGQQVRYNDSASHTYECQLQDVQGELGEYQKLFEWRGTHEESRGRELISGDEGAYGRLEQRRPETACLIPKRFRNPLNRIRELMAFATDEPWETLSIDHFIWVYSTSQTMERSIIRPLLNSAAGSLASITLDLDGMELDRTPLGNHPLAKRTLHGFLSSFFSNTFPMLTSFHYREAQPGSGLVAPDVFIFGVSPHEEDTEPLERSIHGFFARHENIADLSWPIDRFFSDDGDGVLPPDELNTLNRMAWRMKRISAGMYLRPFKAARARIETFIRRLASEFISLEYVKIHGLVPSTLTREFFRATRISPIRVIEIDSPIWPAGYSKSWDMPATDPELPEDEVWLSEWKYMNGGVFFQDMPDVQAIQLHYMQMLPLTSSEVDTLAAPIQPYRFGHGRKEAPLIHILARYYRNTLTHLTLAGFVGCPVSGNPLQLAGLLTPLYRLENLRYFATHFVPASDSQLESRQRMAANWTDHARAVREYDLKVEKLRKSVADRPFLPSDKAKLAKLVHEHPNVLLARKLLPELGFFLPKAAKKRPGGVRLHIMFFTGGVDLGMDLDVDDGEGIELLNGTITEAPVLYETRARDGGMGTWYHKPLRFASTSSTWEQGERIRTFPGLHERP